MKRTRKVYQPVTAEVPLFPPVPDWALEDEHEAQSFQEFVAMERWPVTKARRTIYLLPLGKHYTAQSAIVKDCMAFLATYFQLPVKVAPTLEITFEDNAYHLKSPKYLFPVTSRRNEYGAFQLYDLDLLRIMDEFIPKDAYCVLALTDFDIYEWEDRQAIIMGRGTGDRVGVLSFYRYNRHLTTQQKVKIDKKSANLGKGSMSVIAREDIDFLNACKTMAHETMHMFGLDHCGYYLCVMNANVSPDGDSVDPIQLCPIDLKKLQKCIGFEIEVRYKQLLEYYKKMEWNHEAEWTERRIASMLLHPEEETKLCLDEAKVEDLEEKTSSKKSSKKKSKK